MKAKYSPIAEADLQQYTCPEILQDRTRVDVTDENGNTGYCYMENHRIQKLGKAYIEAHAKLEYSEVCRSWFVSVSENDFYNDETRNPPKEIPLVYVGTDARTGREEYRGIETGRHYLREVSRREPFAKWYVCGNRRTIDDGDEPRANLVFILGDQREKVTYDDWNGVAAYSNTFNPDFRT